MRRSNLIKKRSTIRDMRYANQSGLTLIEIVVAVAVFAVVVTAASAAFVTLGRGTGKAKLSQIVNQTARALIEQISRDAKYAVGAKDPTTGRVWPPFMIQKATGSDSAFDQDSNILIIITTDTETTPPTVKHQIYGIKTAEGKTKLMVSKGNTIPTSPFTTAEELTPPDISVASFNISYLPDPNPPMPTDPNYNWINWKPDCDTNSNLVIEADSADPAKPAFCTRPDIGTKRATQQPLLNISDLTLAAKSDPNTKITLSTSISSRDYDLDN